MEIRELIIKDNHQFYKIFCEYTLIPDTNFELALELLGYNADELINGRVYKNHMSIIDFLNVNNSNIQSLVGIEDFSALESLSFSGNPVTSLDLSENALLELLNCENTNLTTLDVTSNTALIELVATGNQLSTIDLSKTPNFNT